MYIPTLAIYETSKRKPNPDMLDNIANYFKVTTDYLLREYIYHNSQQSTKKIYKKYCTFKIPFRNYT